MARKEYEMIFKLNAQLGGAYSAAFKNARSELVSMQNELQSLNKAQGNIAAYQKQQTALTNTQKKLDLLQQEYENIQREINETGSHSSALENRLLNKQQQIERTTAVVETHTRKLDVMGAALREAGIDTNNLAQESKRLEAEIDGVKTRQQGVIDGFSDGGKRAKFFGDESVSAVQSLQQTLVAAGIVTMIKEIGEAMVECTEEAISFESAVTGVYKTVDGTDQQLAAIKGEIKELATEIPATTEEISAVAESAGQLGIATDNVMSFTEVMIDLGESTNLAAEEAASSLAKFSNITGMQAENYSRLGSVVVDLGNNFATTEADIVAMATRLASSGKLAGLTEPEIMALAAAMSSVGIEAEAGGTAMTQTLSAIEKAVAEGKDSLHEMARIAGMSADEFAKSWESSPMEALQAFIAGLGMLDQAGESSVLVLDELGLSGVRQSNMLKSLSLAASTMTSAVDTANKAWEEDLALSVEAGKRYATTESRLAMLGNSYDNLQAAIGDVYIPTLHKAIDLGMEATEGLTAFVEDHPGAVKGITALAVGVGGATAVIGGFVVATKVAIPAIKALTDTMNANPYLLAASAIVGVVSAVASLAVTAEDEAGPSVRELTEAAREMNEVMDESRETYEDTMATTMAAASVADSYITKLEQMGDYASLAEEEQKEYKNILALLCQTVPELSQYIDLETAAIEGGTSALRANTEAWQQNAMQTAYQEQLMSMTKAHADVLVEQRKNEIELTAATQRKADAEERYNQIVGEMDQLWAEAAAAQKSHNLASGDNLDVTAFLTQEYYDLQDALSDTDAEISASMTEIRRHEKAIEADAEAVAEAEAEIELTKSAIEDLTGTAGENTSELEENAAAAQNIQTALSDTKAEMDALTKAYNEAYEAANQSISGQYALWDQAAAVVATSAATINSGLESQTAYWNSYNSNLQSLTARSADVEGLSEMIASFADGSAESVNAVAGMAAASDADLAAMVANWQALQEAQSGASGSIADLKTDYTAQMQELQSELVEDIKELDMSDDAAESGKNTAQGFIDGATEMLPQVQAAYTALGEAAISALNIKLDTHSPSRKTQWTANMAVEGFIGPAEAREEEVAQAYGNLGGAGAEALTGEVQAVAFAPQLLTALAAQPTLATPVSSAPVISLHIENHVSSYGGEDLTRQMDQNNQNIRDIVEETVERVMEDQNRRAYR